MTILYIKELRDALANLDQAGEITIPSELFIQLVEAYDNTLAGYAHDVGEELVQPIVNACS